MRRLILTVHFQLIHHVACTPQQWSIESMKLTVVANPRASGSLVQLESAIVATEKRNPYLKHHSSRPCYFYTISSPSTCRLQHHQEHQKKTPINELRASHNAPSASHPTPTSQNSRLHRRRSRSVRLLGLEFNNTCVHRSPAVIYFLSSGGCAGWEIPEALGVFPSPVFPMRPRNEADFIPIRT